MPFPLFFYQKEYKQEKDRQFGNLEVSILAFRCGLSRPGMLIGTTRIQVAPELSTGR